ncbi:MAG: hypothetical protein AAF968_12960, partial [Pseudomonadota bacterium]
MTLSKTRTLHAIFILLIAALALVAPAYGSWGKDALTLQEFLDTNNTFNRTTWVGAHNAYAADEWGYLDPNQTLKPRNLLEAGARQMEYDPHKDWQGDLNLCHGICSGFEKKFTTGLDQIVNFIADNPNAVVFLKLEMDDALSKTGDKLENRLGDLIYKPRTGRISTGNACPGRHGLEPEFLTKADILNEGKNVVVFAGNGKLDDCPGSIGFMEWVHVGVEYQATGWQLKFDKATSPSQSGTFYDQGRMTLTHDPNTFNSINGGGAQQIFTRSNVGNYMAHGHNVFELYNFNGMDTLLHQDVKAKHMVWSWEVDEPAGNGDCAVVNDAVGPRFNDVACNYHLRYACYGSVTDTWNVTSGSGPWENGQQACAGEFGPGMNFAVPTNGRQMDDLLNRINGQGIASAVYVNYHDRSIEGVWQANSPIQLDVRSTPVIGATNRGSAIDYGYMIDRSLYTGRYLEVTSARIRAKDRIKGIELTYSNGTVVYYGGGTGSFSSALPLGAGARITHIDICVKRHNGEDRIGHLTFIANTGASISNGQRRGTCQTLALTGNLMGFHGTGGGSYFNSLGFYTAEVAHLQGSEISGRTNAGKCLYKKITGWENGNPIHIWGCGIDTSGRNMWTYEPSTGYIRGTLNPNKCLHKKYGHWGNGNP